MVQTTKYKSVMFLCLQTGSWGIFRNYYQILLNYKFALFDH